MNRAQMIFGLEEIIEASREGKTKEMTPLVFLPLVDDLTDEEKADDEYESLGYFISHNPLEKYRNKLLSLAPISQLIDVAEGSHIRLGGLITNLKEITTKKKKQMAFFDLEDLAGRVEVVVFPSFYAKDKRFFEKNKPVQISGKLEMQSREINGEEVTSHKIILMSISNLEEGRKLEKITLHPQERDDFIKIHDIIISNPGNIPIEIEFKNAILKTDYKLLPDKMILKELESSCLTRRSYGS